MLQLTTKLRISLGFVAKRTGCKADDEVVVSELDVALPTVLAGPCHPGDEPRGPLQTKALNTDLHR